MHIYVPKICSNHGMKTTFTFTLKHSKLNLSVTDWLLYYYNSFFWSSLNIYFIVWWNILTLWREAWRNQRTWPGLRTGADEERLLHFTAIIQGKGKDWFVIHLDNAKKYSTQSFVSTSNQLHTFTLMHIISCMKCFNWFYKSWFTVIHAWRLSLLELKALVITQRIASTIFRGFCRYIRLKLW